VRLQTYDVNSQIQNNALLLGAGQLVYWPDASKEGSLEFTPQRIGGQIRYSHSVGNLAVGNGQNLNLDWEDISLNYRRDPSNIFEGTHIYGVTTFSNYSVIGRTTTRMGGGIGFSINVPKPLLGNNYSGRIYSYIDATILPLDISQDGRGSIFSSKLNGIWLVNEHWFVTGDIEARLLNFAMETENSVLRIQLGGGFAF
jgi:hypothetical protein